MGEMPSRAWMKRRRIVFSALLAFVCTAAALSAFASDIELSVTGGKEDVTDWIAEATVDLAAARSILGWSGRPDRIRIHELDASGDKGEPVAVQVDRAQGKGMFTVAWRVPGKLAAGETRRFALSFGAAQPDKGGAVVRATSDEKTVTVTSGDLQLEHARGMGGMIRRVQLGDAKAALVWNDKIYDGTVYYLANHSAKQMNVVAAGPLRVCVEADDAYLDAGKSPASKPTAAYRFTTYAGQPFTWVEGKVTQDFAHPWRSLHFIEIMIGNAGFTRFVTDQGSGTLEQEGRYHPGSHWAAVYNEQLLLATCACAKPGVYDGGGRHYGAYLKGAKAPMTTLEHAFKAALVYGNGSQAVKDGLVKRWSAILADPPAVHVRLQKLEDRLADVEETVDAKRRDVNALAGKAWAIGHVAATLAGTQAAAARDALGSGRFRAASDALDSCETLLNADGNAADLKQAGPLLAGTVLGHPFLANGRVAYVWSRPDEGCGPISIYDRQAKREFLRTDPSVATFWELALKTPQGGAARQSKGTLCKVAFHADDREARATFRWSKNNVAVEVKARLAASEALLRSRISARTGNPALGLTTVMYPIVDGIAPLSPDGAADRVLETRDIGRAVASPLVSGNVSATHYPEGMQFTALVGDGLGLYVAEEDGQANRKTLTWTPDAETGTLGFSIAHPVLDWGAEAPVREYESPGNLVWGPFEGDWYDAARLYRTWALSAPWCAKGPVYEREDYPKWLLEAPYWTFGHLASERGIERELAMQAFYEIPIMVAHTYAYYFQSTQDDRCPAYWPPKLGSEGLERAIAALQAKGIRTVPYVNGWIWDADTDGFRMKDAKNKGALWGSNGKMMTITSYGGGQTFVGMCPASRLWRETMKGLVRELVGRYGADGVYFDFLTIHTNDCHNKDHGHAIGGGDYWTKGVHGLYEECRALAKELNPDAMITGEDVAEFCIDVQDTFLCLDRTDTNAPLFQAVYHGYANLFGGCVNKWKPVFLGRWWLMGNQNGWHNVEDAMIGNPPYEIYAAAGRYYKKLLKCRWEFATPYLGYGEMLRPPRIEGDVPTVGGKTNRGPFTVPAIEGSAWKAPDGTVGVFLLNYDDKNAHEVTWRVDLSEIGIDASKRVRISRWTPDKGLVPLDERPGGRLTEEMTIEPLGIVALKLEKVE